MSTLKSNAVKKVLLVFSLILIGLSSNAQDPMNIPASPLSLNTLHASIKQQANILDLIYKDAVFTEKLNELRKSVGDSAALMVLGYSVHATPKYATLMAELGILTIGSTVKEYGTLNVMVYRNSAKPTVFKIDTK